MHCQEFEIEAYAIGALDVEEMNEIEQHLKSCEQCRAALERYQETLAQLSLEVAMSIPEFEAPVDHKARFMQKLEQRPQLRLGSISPQALIAEPSSVLPTVSPAVAKLSKIKKNISRLAFSKLQLKPAPLLTLSLLLMLVMIVGLVGWTSHLNEELTQQKAQAANLTTQLNAQSSLDSQLHKQLQQSQTQLSQQQAELTTLRNQISTAQNQNQVFQNISLLLNEHGATTRHAQSSNNQAALNILMAPQDTHLTLFASSFPQLQSGEVYQLWLYKGTQFVRGPTFSVISLNLPDGTAAITLEAPEPMASYTALLITIEPANTPSPAPSPDNEVIRDNLVA